MRGVHVLLERAARNLARPAVGLILAVALLAAALLLGVLNERSSQAGKIAEVQVQARILATSLAGPLAFDDLDSTREYVDALRARGDIGAAGAYAADGRIVAGFSRNGTMLRQANRVGPPIVRDRQLVVTAPVVEAGTQLGSVRLVTAIEPWQQRALRYLGIALVVALASLLVGVLASLYAQTSAAHSRLRAEIASRREAEEALRQSQKMEAMGQLTGGVAHDFNNLLMVASSGIDLLDRTDDPAKRARLMDGIRQAIDRGAKLTQQLLTFARRSPMRPEVIDLAARIRGLKDLLERSLREDIAIALDFTPGTWPVEVDPSQLEVAVLNMAINARDAMADGGTITIGTINQPSTGDAPDVVSLFIRDTGSGIAPDLLQKVFEPFFTTKGVGNGTGLGLSQVYGFVRSSGGEVAIGSEEGVGTTISLLFPRSTKALPHRIYRSTPTREGNGTTRVLLVEDDDSVAELVGAMLTELGYGSSRANSGNAALDLLRQDRRFDLVLSDMIMPGKVNGLELAHQVGRLYSELPVVLMTGFSEAAASAAAEGIPLLVKPYSIDALGETIHKALA